MNKPRVKLSRRTRPEVKFEEPKDIKFRVYTNDEIMAILQLYNNQVFDHLREPISTETINAMLAKLERMKFLIGEIRQGQK